MASEDTLNLDLIKELLASSEELPEERLAPEADSAEGEYQDPHPTWQPKTESASTIRTEPKWDLRPKEISEDDLPFDENEIRWG